MKGNEWNLTAFRREQNSVLAFPDLLCSTVQGELCNKHIRAAVQQKPCRLTLLLISDVFCKKETLYFQEKQMKQTRISPLAMTWSRICLRKQTGTICLHPLALLIHVYLVKCTERKNREELRYTQFWLEGPANWLIILCLLCWENTAAAPGACKSTQTDEMLALAKRGWRWL